MLPIKRYSTFISLRIFILYLPKEILHLFKCMVLLYISSGHARETK